MNVDHFIGKPFRALGTGPDAFDCWGLARAAALDLFGVAWPAVPYGEPDVRDASRVVAAHLRPPSWRACPTAKPGALCAMGGFGGTVTHVALCLDATRVLHTAPRLRSCVVPLVKIANAFPRVRFYEWAP